MGENEGLLKGLASGDRRSLAKAITMVENEQQGYEDLLQSLDSSVRVPVIGITGPPGAGKSTLINALVSFYSANGQSTGIIAIDPSSPFNFGSLLGDRLRMSEHFNDPRVFIRSLASRGSLGGLSAKTMEVCDIMRHAGFDRIIVETVGVGQSEVEIAGLADTTVLVLVPEAGDEIQTLKSGIMEIADIFVVNKSDREGADTFVKHLEAMIHGKPGAAWKIPVLKCIASSGTGIKELSAAIDAHHAHADPEKRLRLLTEKAWQLLVKEKMKNIDRKKLEKQIREKMHGGDLNLYLMVKGMG